MPSNTADNLPVNAESSENVESFPDEPQNDPLKFAFVKENVSDRDIFKLAKNILLCVFIAYIGIAICRIYCTDAKGITEVWEYSKVILNSIASLVLGLYFGKKK
jgi:hypothetical protein